VKHAATAHATASIPWRKLALLLLACAVLRGFLILAPPDDFFENGAIPHEEMLRGIAAQELLDGPLAPIQRYQVNNFWGGSLVVSMLATVPYAVFGAKLVALRGVALLFGLACVAILFVLLHRHSSPRAAWIGATLLAFAPPGYAMSSCTTYGTHLEANALALLVVCLVLEEQRSRPGLSNAGHARTFLLGFAAGFALWFGFSLLLVLAAWILHEFARDRAFMLGRRAGFLALGFLAGFWPWIRYQLVHGWSGLEIYDQGLSGHLLYGISRGSAAEKVLTTLSTTGPLSFCFRDTLSVSGIWIGRVFIALALFAVVRAALCERTTIAALVRGTQASRATPTTLALTFLALFSATYAFSAFDVAARDWIFDLRYLMPPVPFVCLLAGVVGADVSRQSPSAGRVAFVVTILCATTCVVATLRQARPARFEAAVAQSGTSETQLVRFLSRNFSAEPEAALEVADRIVILRQSPRREALLAAFGRGVRVLAARSGGTPAEQRRAAGARTSAVYVPQRLPPEYARIFGDP